MHDKSAKSGSQVNLCPSICEKKNVVKRIFLYQQRRFPKLGNTVASVLEALTIIKKLKMKLAIITYPSRHASHISKGRCL